MMRLENKFFSDSLYFGENSLYFKLNYDNNNSFLIIVNDETHYMEYFTECCTDNGKLSFAFNYINFLSQAWNKRPKCNFTKEDIMTLIRHIEDEKLKFFLYAGCKSVLDCKHSYKYMKDFCTDVLEYYKENPVNEKLVNMELKLSKGEF